MALPEHDVTSAPMNHLNRWELLRSCHQSFWKRWTQEYISTLQGRLKWYDSNPNLAIGDLVIVEAPNHPPSDWQLGQIIAVHPGKDAVVRTVTVRTQEGTLKKPVAKLVKLPVA